MIFVTMGSSKIAPMYALGKCIDEIAAHLSEEIVVQYGVTSMDYRHVKALAYCDTKEMADFLGRADIVISHGGWGSLSQCISLGKRLIAVPRIHGLEVNHDQEQLVKKLEELKCLIGVYDLKNMESAIEHARVSTFSPLPRGNINNILMNHLKAWGVRNKL